jgi:acyl-coenzyme A thioesterase PaaI-like protein
MTADQFNNRSLNYLPGHLGLRITHTGVGESRGEISTKEIHYAPNGYLHAGAVVTLADSCSYGWDTKYLGLEEKIN